MTIIFGFASAFFFLVAQLIYLWSIKRQGVQPHFFTWLIWSTTALIVGFAQLEAGGELGAYTTFFQASVNFIITIFAWRFNAQNIKPADFAALGVALLALPLWLITEQALLAVIWLTVIDLAGYFPTLRKSWQRPWQENILVYALGMPANFCSIMTMAEHNLTTLLYPAMIISANLLLIIYLAWRRRMVRGQPAPT